MFGNPIRTALIIAILGLAASTKYFYSRTNTLLGDVARLEQQKAQVEISLKSCSDATSEVARRVAEKQAKVEKARVKAEEDSKGNEKIAQKVLGAEKVGDSCKAAVELYKKYKEGKVGL